MPSLFILFLIFKKEGVLNHTFKNNLDRAKNKSLDFKNEILAIKWGRTLVRKTTKIIDLLVSPNHFEIFQSKLLYLWG